MKMNIQVMGTYEECFAVRQFYWAIENAPEVKMCTVSPPYKNLIGGNQYRVYVEIEYKDGVAPLMNAIQSP